MSALAASERIQQSMNPLLITLKLFGLYYDSPTKISIADQNTEMIDAWSSDTKKTFPCLKIIQRIYCYLVLTLITLSTLRFIPSFWVGMDYISGLLINRVIILSWFFQCNLSLIVILRHCQKGTWDEYFRLWNESIADTKCMCLNSVLKRLRVFTAICTALGVFFTLFNIIGSSVMALAVKGNFLTTFVNPFTDSWAWIVIFFICLIFYSAIWAFTVCTILICCKSIQNAFCVYSTTLQNTLKASAKSFPQTFDLLRRRHLSLCRLVEKLDRPISFLLIIVLATNIFLACFILYHLVNSMNNTTALVMYIMWLSTSFISTSLISYNVAVVHDAAHSPLDHIYEIETDNLTTQQLAQLTLFLSKLTGPSIGFTVLTLFTVTKEFILTIGGLYLTYFFLLLQFKIT